MKNKIALALVVLAVIASIAFLEARKPPRSVATSALETLTDPSAPDSASSSSAAATGAAATTSRATSSISSVVPHSEAQNLKDFLASRSGVIALEKTKYQAAPEIANPSGFINTAPIKLADFIGKKVVLLDFWTYSCINCIRTIPHLNAWYEKYKDQGLVVIGIHTPEFDFEHDKANVAAAVEKFGIKYPVVLDNDYGTWLSYQNRYWPHEYVINIDGFITDDTIGEGNYDGTERAIQAALAERTEALNIKETISTGSANPSSAIAIDYGQVQSPETYFGAARNSFLANGTAGQSGTQSLAIPADLSVNALYLGGAWNFSDQYAENASANAEIVYRYEAKNVYLVASADQPVVAKIFWDDKPLTAERGSDVNPDGTITVQSDRLYEIIQGATYGTHTLRIIVSSPGLKAFTITFG